jgi:DNA-binding response OmpR family regulator
LPVDDKPLRILIVEDEFFVGILLEEDLRASGFQPLGPITSVAVARETIRRETFDLAILDINLNGEMVYPLADDLVERRIPFIFLSGYSELNLPERFRDVARLSKPYHLPRLVERIRLLARGE